MFRASVTVSVTDLGPVIVVELIASEDPRLVSTDNG